MPHNVEVCTCGHDYGYHEAAGYGLKRCEIRDCQCLDYKHWRTERRPGW